MYILSEVLNNKPEVRKTYNQSKFDSGGALSICLKRFSYLCRFSYMVSRFRQSDPEFSMMSNIISDLQ